MIGPKLCFLGKQRSLKIRIFRHFSPKTLVLPQVFGEMSHNIINFQYMWDAWLKLKNYIQWNNAWLTFFFFLNKTCIIFYKFFFAIILSAFFVSFDTVAVKLYSLHTSISHKTFKTKKKSKFKGKTNFLSFKR